MKRRSRQLRTEGKNDSISLIVLPLLVSVSVVALIVWLFVGNAGVESMQKYIIAAALLICLFIGYLLHIIVNIRKQYAQSRIRDSETIHSVRERATVTLDSIADAAGSSMT